MQNVSRFEAGLLRLLYYFLRREPVERAVPLIEGRMEPPPCLAQGAVRLVKEALAKGSTYLLAQRGGWRDERHLRNGKPISGRLWQRTAPADLGLSFSRKTMEFLIWITAARPGDKSPTWQPDHDELTHGDLLFLFFAHEGLRDTADSLGAPALRKKAPFMYHALCWLAYPEDFTQVPADVVPKFAPWMSGVGSAIIEALQPALMARWLHVEANKERIEKPEVMRALGISQDRVLAAFLEACEKSGRRDLARFLLRASQQLLTNSAHSGMWTGALQMSGQRLADRAATYNAATALLRYMDRLAGWARWARTQGRFDEEYLPAQLYLADWERLEGEDQATRAHDIIRTLDPMRQAARPQT
jgi:hypothetical protein